MIVLKGRLQKEGENRLKEPIFALSLGTRAHSLEGKESGGLARFVTVQGRVAFPKARPPL